MVDVASLVPSSRDFLQTIASRRKCLALIPLVDRPDDARSMAEQGVRAFAISSASVAGPVISVAVGTCPLLLLGAVASPDDTLRARATGADAVVVAGEGAAWEALAKHVRSTRMAPLAIAEDVESALAAATTPAKGILLRGADPSHVLAMAAKVSSLRIVAHLPAADETALRALRGKVDAAIVESDLYLSTSFATLHEELDP
jgi:hypothetical protein